jgi:hypothetical protein
VRSQFPQPQSGSEDRCWKDSSGTTILLVTALKCLKKVPPAGVELNSITANDAKGLQKQTDPKCAYSVQNPPDDRLQEIIDAWPGLSEELQSEVIEMIRER